MKRREQLVSLCEACNGLKSLEQIHSQVLKAGLKNDTYLATKLNALYAKHASLRNARKVFDETPHRTVYLWNSTLRSYCKEKRWEETLRLFHNMVPSGRSYDESPDNFTVSIALKACAGLRALEYGKTVHGFVEKHDDIGRDMYVGCALIELYSKCGLMNDALRVFKDFTEPDIVLWTSMITGYEQNGDAERALQFFSWMVMVKRLNPTRVTLVTVASACAQLSNFGRGSSIHCFAIRRGLDTDLPLVNSLINLYAKTNCTRYATRLFQKLPERDVVSWSSIIACCAHNGAAAEALALFNKMVDKKIEPNSVTVVGALQACAVLSNSEEGQKIHKLSVQKGFELDVAVSTALIDMYMKCFIPEKAKALFERMPKKDVVAFSAMLSGYAHNEMVYNSIEVFRYMLLKEVQPDAVTIVKVLGACSQLGVLDQARSFHGYVKKKGFCNNIFVGASLVELYSKCGSIDDAVLIFEEIVEKDVFIWSAMIEAYAVHGCGFEAVNLFDKMVKSSFPRPNNVTFLSVLYACTHSGLVEKGIEIFNTMTNEYKLKPNSEHYAIIVDLLGRMGEIDKAIEFINSMAVPAGPHVWGAVLGACRIHHNVELGNIAAKNLFDLETNHAGYYALLSNIYAVEGRWENVTQLRREIKEKKMKRAFGKSTVYVGRKISSFVAGDHPYPESESICELLRNLDVKMKEESSVGDIELSQHVDGIIF